MNTGIIYGISADRTQATILPSPGAKEVAYKGDVLKDNISNNDGVSYETDETGTATKARMITNLAVEGTPTTDEAALVRELIFTMNKRGGGTPGGGVRVIIRTRDV